MGSQFNGADISAMKERALSQVAEEIKKKVPERTWRQFVVEKTGDDDAARARESVRVMARMQNDAVDQLSDQADMLTRFGKGLAEGKLEPGVRSPRAVERGRVELRELGARIQGRAETLRGIITDLGKFREDIRDAIENETAPAPGSAERVGYDRGIYDRYQAIRERAYRLKKELQEDQDNIIRAGFSAAYKVYLKHGNAIHGVIALGIVIAAVNTAFPSYEAHKILWGAFGANVIAGIGGNIFLRFLRYPESAMTQTGAGQALVWGASAIPGLG